MKPLIYLDSNVFIAMVLGEMGKPFRMMYKQAEDFFEACKGRFVVVISGQTLSEIAKNAYWSNTEVINWFRSLGIETETVELIKQDSIKAIEISSDRALHMEDALHVAVALRTGCGCLVTWNIKHFSVVRDLIDIKEPSDFL